MTTTPSATDSLTTDRNNTIRRVVAVWLVVGIMVGLTFGPAGGLTGELVSVLVSALMFGLTFGLTAGLVTAWGQWLVFVRVWLPLTGRLPWPVYAFLTDAYHRGVLRQAGAVYQFRHARLQDHLTHRHRHVAGYSEPHI
jgi:hypothetical protein